MLHSYIKNMEYKIYSQHYLTYKRIKDESDFIHFLNNQELQVLIQPALMKVTNELYLIISSGKPNKGDSVEILLNDEVINTKLKEKLSSSQLFIPIEKHDFAGSLFTYAFNKLNKRLFEKDGNNDDNYFIQSYVRYWLEDNLAKLIVKDDRFSSYGSIRKLLYQTELLHHFYNTFKNEIPLQWISKHVKDWISAPNEFSQLLDHIRTFDKDYFYGYENKLNKLQQLSPWKFVLESTQFSDYAVLNEEYSFKNMVLFHKDLQLWMKFWDNLKLPLIQNIVFLYFDSPVDYLSIAMSLNRKKNKLKSSPKHLALILLSNLFNSMKKVQENLSFFVNEKQIKDLSEHERDEEILLHGKNLYEKWLTERSSIYTTIFKNLSPILNYDEISEWVFSYKPREVSSTNEYNKLYNEQIALLVDSFNSCYEYISFENKVESLFRNFSLQNFNALVKQIEKNSEQTKDLLSKLTEFIISEDFYWDRTFSEMYWATIKSIGILISYCEDPQDIAKELLEKVKVYHEGWKISNSDYKLTQREAFILCGIMLLLEHKKSFKNQNQRKLFFEFILNYTISQMRFANQSENDDYLLPIYLICLLVNQIYPSFKNHFESELINGVDDLIMVLKVLTSSEYQISLKGKTKLNKRIDKELPYIRQRLLQKNQAKEVEEIELMVNRVKETITNP